jgi:DNA-binding XRE family transcriptional regulator
MRSDSLLPKRRKNVSGRRPDKFPDLNFKVIAKAIGCNPSSVSRIMNGAFRPSMEMAQKLAAVMEWPLEKVAALYQPPKKRGKR